MKIEFYFFPPESSSGWFALGECVARQVIIVVTVDIVDETQRGYHRLAVDPYVGRRDGKSAIQFRAIRQCPASLLREMKAVPVVHATVAD